MGHFIIKDGLRSDSDKVKAVQEMPSPTSKKELLSLLGFINYLSKFLPRLSKVATDNFPEVHPLCPLPVVANVAEATKI